jgi:ATP-dependent Lon protease
VPRRVLKALRLVLVEHVDDVLREALVLPDTEAVFGPRPEGVMLYVDGEPVPAGTPSGSPALPVPPSALPAVGEQPGA